MRPRFRPLLACIALSLLTGPLAAQQAGQCRAPELVVAADERPPMVSEDTFVILADRAEWSRNEVSVISGNVQIWRMDTVLETDEARYDPATGDISAAGNVRFRQPGLEISGRSAQFEGESERGAISLTNFSLPERGGRGSADSIAIEDKSRVIMRGVRYTTCAGDRPDWELIAPGLKLDNEKGSGSGRNVRVEFKGIPLIYTPYISFPISDKRKSGFLTPDFGHANRSGTALRLPYYWNIAPNYDATFTPRLLFERGLQLNTEFRYLKRRARGQLDVEYLPNDDETGTDRSFLQYRNNSQWGRRWSTDADLNNVSDNAYFEDLGNSSSEASRTHLQRRVDFNYQASNWRFLTRWHFPQTIVDSIGPDERPYKRLPQLALNGDWQRGEGGLGFGLDGELVNFDRSVGVTGLRLDLEPELRWEVRGDGYYLAPRASYRFTRYDLDDVAPGEDEQPSRSVPVFSLDSGLVFERDTRFERDIVQTLEPRVYYTYIPFRDQSALPVFDTDRADFNLVQLYRTNRFVGADRLGDANQISLGVTTRFLDTADGHQYLGATLGQTIFFEDRRVTLPGETISTSNSSDIIAEVALGLSRRWRADLGLQFDPSAREATKAAARLSYAPGERRILNLGYRYRRDQLEQSDIAVAWPLRQRWRFIGRWNYSIRDSQTLDRLLGLEYERCCWGLRFASRRFITTRDGQSDTSLLLQLELKGLSSVGRSAESFLEHGILGYSRYPGRYQD